MSEQGFAADFRAKVSERVLLRPEGVGRYRVETPFEFDDGDGLVIVLTRRGSEWLLTDEAHTFMRLSYDLDEAALRQGSRQKIIENALNMGGVEERDGELVLPVSDERPGDALFSFVQTILRIADVSYLSRERVLSTFGNDFRTFLEHTVPPTRRSFDWHDAVTDPKGNYTVDCRINGSETPLFAFGLLNDSQTSNATITILHFEKLGTRFRSLAVFEDQERIGRKALARFTDVCDRQFTNLAGNRDRIEAWLREAGAG